MIKVLNSVETNEFFNIEKSNNGGGYSQPKITFEYGGITGVYHDTSCGDFGTRFTVEWNGKKFELDEVQHGTCPDKNYRYVSTFSDADKNFIEEFEKLFGKKIMTIDEVEKWDDFIWEKYSN